MALQVILVPDVRALLGVSWQKVKVQLHPNAVSDYPTGGYPLTASAVSLGLISGLDITATNAAGKLYTVVPVFPAGSFGANPAPASSINLVVVTAGAEVANLTDLTSLYWDAEVDGW
jgi:hypothetical protein